jgi:hypothetical protein
MRFKTDENLPLEVAELLRQHQHDALRSPTNSWPDSPILGSPPCVRRKAVPW